MSFFLFILYVVYSCPVSTRDLSADTGDDNWYKESAAIPPAPKVAANPAVKAPENTSWAPGGPPGLVGPSGMGPEPDWQVTRAPHDTGSRGVGGTNKNLILLPTINHSSE